MRLVRALMSALPSYTRQNIPPRMAQRTLCSHPPVNSSGDAQAAAPGATAAYGAAQAASVPEAVMTSGSYRRAFPPRRRVVLDEQEAWVEAKPTRVIASKLLDAPDLTLAHGALYAAVEPSGLFPSRRHFKQCLKILGTMNRVNIACVGPKEDPAGEKAGVARPTHRGKAKRRHNFAFAVQLTTNGQRVYSLYRRVAMRRAAEGSDSEAEGGDAKGDGSKKVGQDRSPGLMGAV